MANKMDPKLVAKDEAYYISKTYKIPIKTVRLAKATANKGLKPSRSRARIYAQLVAMKWMVVTKVKGKNKYSQVAQNDRPY